MESPKRGACVYYRDRVTERLLPCLVVEAAGPPLRAAVLAFTTPSGFHYYRDVPAELPADAPYWATTYVAAADYLRPAPGTPLAWIDPGGRPRAAFVLASDGASTHFGPRDLVVLTVAGDRTLVTGAVARTAIGPRYRLAPPGTVGSLVCFVAADGDRRAALVTASRDRDLEPFVSDVSLLVYHQDCVRPWRSVSVEPTPGSPHYLPLDRIEG